MLVLIWTCFQYIHLAPCGLYTGWLMTTSVVLWNNKCCFIYCRSSIVICSVHWVVWSLQIAYYVIIAGSQQLEVVECLLVGLQRGEGNFQFDDIALPPSLFSWVSFFNNQHHCCTPLDSLSNMCQDNSWQEFVGYLYLQIASSSHWAPTIIVEHDFRKMSTNLVVCHGPGS